MKKVVAISLALLIVLIGLPTALAQDSLAYGDTITGTISNEDFSFEYTFEGAENDVVVIEMRRTNTDEDMTRPQLTLLDSEGDDIATTEGEFSYGYAVLAAKLPASGVYTIVATRNDGAEGDSVGEFELELIQPQMLEADTDLVEGEVDNEVRDQYFYVPSEGNTTIVYQPGDSTYVPIVSVNVVDRGTLRTLGQLAGVFIEQATATVDMDGDEIYIVVIGVDESDYLFRDVQSDFAIGVAAE